MLLDRDCPRVGRYGIGASSPSISLVAMACEYFIGDAGESNGLFLGSLQRSRSGDCHYDTIAADSHLCRSVLCHRADRQSKIARNRNGPQSLSPSTRTRREWTTTANSISSLSRM